MEETTNTTNNEEAENNRWAWIVTGVVIVVVVAGFYMWPKGSSPANAPEETPIVQEEIDASAAALQQVSPSDEVADIEQDLNNTDLSGLDKEVTDVETEVNAQ